MQGDSWVLTHSVLDPYVPDAQLLPSTLSNILPHPNSACRIPSPVAWYYIPIQLVWLPKTPRSLKNLTFSGLVQVNCCLLSFRSWLSNPDPSQVVILGCFLLLLLTISVLYIKGRLVIQEYNLDRRRQWHLTPVLRLENPMDGGAW